MKAIIVLFVGILMLALACSEVATSNSTRVPRATRVTQTPVFPSDKADLAISQIESYPEVLEAAIKQNDDDLSLVIIVIPGLSSERAKELGDNFARMVKSFGPEEAPTKNIGRGLFNYLVGVYYPNEAKVVIGAKVKNRTSITW